MKLSKYWKAAVAGVVAGAGALGTAAQDGRVTGPEGLAIAGAFLAAAVAVWRVPNKGPKDPA
ncbi:hypothetical protein ACIRJO_02985 [Streptomyces sp. NPDC102394]|uniref:hypothetical protein n=1 Tax=Streptomyces sp. NPDC102394 TaxID=3366167 RepID=UPI0037F71726